jgi:hypothetical protein
MLSRDRAEPEPPFTIAALVSGYAGDPVNVTTSNRARVTNLTATSPSRTH